jgi:hypothetical protein
MFPFCSGGPKADWAPYGDAAKGEDACLHRQIFTMFGKPGEHIGAREGNVKTIDALSFRCTKCGRRSYTAHLFRERRQVKRFMAEYR